VLRSHERKRKVDETGFKQRNGDGQNAAKIGGLLWVAVTSLIICFQVILSRASTAAQTVLGSAFAGFITSDRCPAYNWVDVANRSHNFTICISIEFWQYLRSI
jgi:Transposase IS66 family